MLRVPDQVPGHVVQSLLVALHGEVEPNNASFVVPRHLVSESGVVEANDRAPSVADDLEVDLVLSLSFLEWRAGLAGSSGNLEHVASS